MPDRKLAPYGISINNVEAVDQPGHGGVSLLYLLKGSVTIRTSGASMVLHPDDIILINHNQRYQIEGHEANVMARLEIASHYFAQYCDDYFHYRFRLLPEQQSGFGRQYINNVKVLAARAFAAHIGADSQFASLEINRSLSEIMLLLVLHFREEKMDSGKSSAGYSKRIAQVVRFLETNYRLPVSLQEVADQEHVSFAHLSRLFKKEVGISFTQYLMKQRFEHGVQDLMATDHPVYQIAQQNGFPNTRQFTAMFKQAYGGTPQQFRSHSQCDKNRAAARIRQGHSSNDELRSVTRDADPMEVLALLSNVINRNQGQRHYLATCGAEEPVTVSLPDQRKLRKLQRLDYIVALGELNEVLKSDIQDQITTIQQEIGLSYVEVHHLISGSTILPDYQTDEAFPSLSPYANSDTAIAFLKRLGIALFVRIYHRDVVEDPEKYAEKLVDFIRHGIHMFGADYMQRWHFVYFSESDATAISPAFERSCRMLRRTIKSLLPRSAVGLFYHFPANDELRHDPVFNGDLITSADFLGYAANPNEQIDLSQFDGNDFADSEHYVREKTIRIKSALKYHDLKLPLYLLSWNTLTGDTRRTNGMFFRGALILRTLHDLSSQINGVGIWINADIQRESLSERIDISSLALFYVFNTRRPVFYALKFQRRLQGDIVSQGANHLVTETSYGYQVILTNVVSFNPYMSVRTHLLENFRRVKYLTIQGLRPGIYQVRRFIFDQQHGALYHQFELLQSRYGKDDEIIEYLHRLTVPQLTVSDEEIQSRWEVICEMDFNAIHFFELRRMS